MNLLNVSCNNCGSSLQINDNINFVTCNSCNTLLKVVKTGSSFFTIEHQTVDANTTLRYNTAQANHSNAQIYAEIEILDREWNNKLPNYMVRGTLPDTDGALPAVMGVFVIIFGIIWTFGAASMFPPFALFGVVFVIVGIWNLINHSNRRSNFLKAKDEYEIKRNALQMRLKK